MKTIKMKLKSLLFGTFVFVSLLSFGQADGENRECDRMLYLAQQARVEKQDFKESSVYMIKAEKECGGLDKKNMSILIASLKNAISAIADANEQKAYIDTLCSAFDRARKVDAYDSADDLLWAYYQAQSNNPNPELSDSLFNAGIKVNGTATKEHYLSFYYYNLYVLYAGAPNLRVQNAYKTRMIQEYFSLSKLVTDAGMSVKAQENLNNYLNAIIQSCEDIVPELDNFLANVPTEKNNAVTTIQNFMLLLEQKQCTDVSQYEALVKKWDEIDPSLASKLAVGKLLMTKGKYSEAINAFREVQGITDDAELKDESQYSIAYCQFKSGSYKSSYSTAMSVGGSFKGKALILAAQAVAKNKDNCGVSTFERKCNFYYAVELLERARGEGESVGSMIGTYRSNFPTETEIFENGSPSTVTISCYGVTVSVK